MCPPITAGFETGGDGPPITIDLNPTPLQTGGDAHFEPAVIGSAGVVQALFQTSGMPKTLDEIVQKVEQAYWNYPDGRANRIFLTLQGCLREIMKEKGG